MTRATRRASTAAARPLAIPPSARLFGHGIVCAMLALAIGLVFLLVGADFNVRGSGSLGVRAGLSPIVVGLTLVAFGTSAPELVVSLRSIAVGEEGIALGNVIGSNICNVLLILGVASLIRPMQVNAQFVRVDVPLMCGVSLLLCLLVAFDALGRVAGAGLVTALAAYTALCVRGARQESDEIVAAFDVETPTPRRSLAFDFGMTLLGLGLLIGGATIFVRGAIELAHSLGVPPQTIGLTVVAVGTSLPELASSVVASLRDNGDVSIGNIVGSNLFNILGILGVVALVQPIDATRIRAVDLAVLLGSAVALLVALQTRRRIERWEGALLLGGFGLYIQSLVHAAH